MTNSSLPIGPQPQINLFAEGADYEIGVVQGEALGDAFQDAYGLLKHLEAFRNRKPWFVPFGVFRWMAEKQAASYLGRVRDSDSDFYDRVRGIADGAKTSAARVAVLNLLEPMLSAVQTEDDVPAGSACSAAAVTGSRSHDGSAILAHNFDYLPITQPYYVLRKERSSGGFRSLIFSVSPLAGAIGGINERGLAASYNYLFTTDEPSTPAPPLSFRLSQALAKCRTVAEASEFLSSRSRWGAGLLMLADADGSIGSLEITSTRSQLRDGDEVLFHTNQCATEDIEDVQVGLSATHGKFAPRPLRGRTVLGSSVIRDARFEDLFSRGERYSADDLRTVMADHSEENVGSADTICMHSDYWFTTASVQLFPSDRKLRISYSPTCEAVFSEFAV